MATSQIAHDHDAVEVEIFVAAPPARVFQAITDPAQTTQWWGQKGRYRVTNSHADLRQGGTWYTSGIGADGTEFSVSGTSDGASEVWRALPGVESVRSEDGLVSLNVREPHRTIPALLDAVDSRGSQLLHLTTRQASLEDVFVRLTGRHLRED